MISGNSDFDETLFKVIHSQTLQLCSHSPKNTLSTITVAKHIGIQYFIDLGLIDNTVIVIMTVTKIANLIF
jgi:hypothetical protein